MFGIFSKTVVVTFLDAATGETIAKSEMPPDQLPDSFGLDTDLEIGGQHFVVVQAVPMTKVEFTKTRRLSVTLRKVQSLDPGTILYSLPSICGSALPRFEPQGESGNLLVLHEDDWRQCEFVASSFHQELETELQSVSRIHAEAALSVGWSEIHVREQITNPLPPGTRWRSVTDLLGEFSAVDGVAFDNTTNRVSNAVAVRLPDNVVVWSIEEADDISVLCVENLGTASDRGIAALERVAEGLSLTLVSWCRCQAYASSGVEIVGAVGLPWSRQHPDP